MSRHFHVIYQKDSMQCGVACLAMICRFFGRGFSLGYLDRLCAPTAEGVSLKGIADAAGTLGLKTAAARVSTDELRSLPLPCILHWNQNHFTVLHRVTKRRFHVADPGKGRRAFSRGEFEKHWLSTESEGQTKGIALFFEPTEEFRDKPCEETDTKEKRSFRFLFRRMGAFRTYLLQIVLGLLLVSGLQLVIPFLTQTVVDTGIRFKDIGFIRLILFGQLMVILGRTVTDFIRRRLLLHVSMRVNISLLSDFFAKLLRLPMRFFDTKLSGDLLQRMSDHARVQTFLTDQVLGIAFTLISFVVFGIVLLCYDPLIFLIFALGAGAYAAWTVAFLRRRRVLDLESFEAQARASSTTWQLITTMQEIKLQGCGGRRTAEWEDSQASLFDLQMKGLRLRQTQETGSVMIRETVNILITLVAASAVIGDDMTLGAMLAVQYVAGQLSSPVDQLMAFIYSLQDVRLSLERINEIHERPDECKARPDTGLQTYEQSSDAAIAIRDVCFRYDLHSPEMTLSDISLSVPRGKTTAIVGASGSGKTTLVKLMLGFYPAESGVIEIDGTDIQSVDIESWRRRCGAVMQEGVVFSDSIARNIAVGEEDVDINRLEQAARAACIHDFVMSLPLKYNTKVGADGTGLSRGQKQRILIARAVYKDPEVIFLDEATNSLDAVNEREITDALARFSRGRTVVTVAHRLSTVCDADNIVVLDHGRIVETGTHESLIQAKGHYYTLIKNQLELGT